MPLPFHWLPSNPLPCIPSYHCATLLHPFHLSHSPQPQPCPGASFHCYLWPCMVSYLILAHLPMGIGWEWPLLPQLTHYQLHLHHPLIPTTTQNHRQYLPAISNWHDPVDVCIIAMYFDHTVYHLQLPNSLPIPDNCLSFLWGQYIVTTNDDKQLFWAAYTSAITNLIPLSSPGTMQQPPFHHMQSSYISLCWNNRF